MSKEQYIPKIIHYCWFGGNPLPEDAVKCIESWKRYCPDYEIMEWNETNFPTDFNDYTKEAYECKKWAFVSDVARLYALVNYGGIYMDTDVELLKSLDDMLSYEAVYGFEHPIAVATCVMGAMAHHPFFEATLDSYKDERFILPDGTQNMMTNVERITNACVAEGLKLDDTKQTVLGITFLPHDYFCPKDLISHSVAITANTYAIHHLSGSWLPEEKIYAKEFRVRHPKIPRCIALHISGFVAACKYRGFIAAVKEVFIYFKSQRHKKKAAREARRKNANKQ